MTTMNKINECMSFQFRRRAIRGMLLADLEAAEAEGIPLAEFVNRVLAQKSKYGFSTQQGVRKAIAMAKIEAGCGQ